MEHDIEYGITRQGSLFREFPPMEHEMSMYRATAIRTRRSEPRLRSSSSAQMAAPSTSEGDKSSRVPHLPPTDADGYTGDLRELVEFLLTPMGLRLFKTAFRENMTYKVNRYDELQRNAEQDVAKQIQVIQIKTPELKRIARTEGDGDNWLIFESISEQYHEAKNRAAAFEAIKIRAQERLDESVFVEGHGSVDALRDLRDGLVAAIRNLSNYSSQAHVVSKAVNIVDAFIKDPRLFRSKLMNFMLLGGAGTGKTSLASAIGDVFAKAGIFVGDKLIEAGRAELVGQYEGQTVARTRNFLVNNLDNGVIFVDEAYAITPWQNGKPEGYGSEAATAMVEFMSRYPGLYCIIVAGYETQMVRYFLPTNEGLSRRFPNKYVLNDMSASDLVDVFKIALLRAQGVAVPDGRKTRIASTNYFTEDAWAYLHNLVYACTRGTVEYTDEFDPATRKTYGRVRSFKPTWEYMYAMFEYQAGSMTNLADEALAILMSTVSYQQILQAQRRQPADDAAAATTTTMATTARLPFVQQPKAVMRRIVVQTILKTSLSDAELFLSQLSLVESIL